MRHGEVLVDLIQQDGNLKELYSLRVILKYNLEREELDKEYMR